MQKQLQYKFIHVQENQALPVCPTFSPLQFSPSRKIQMQSAPIQPGFGFRSRSIAQIVTWKAKNDSESRRTILMPLVLNFIAFLSCLGPKLDSVYNSEKGVRYIDQCFTKREKIGEGSFGSV